MESGYHYKHQYCRWCRVPRKATLVNNKVVNNNICIALKTTFEAHENKIALQI